MTTDQTALAATPVRDAGATQVLTARSPDENALLDALIRALRP